MSSVAASRLAQSPEVTGEVGRRAAALVYAMIEASHAGRPVSIAEVENVNVDAYQREIDTHFKLI